jgi:hypothetical protein
MFEVGTALLTDDSAGHVQAPTQTELLAGIPDQQDERATKVEDPLTWSLPRDQALARQGRLDGKYAGATPLSIAMSALGIHVTPGALVSMLAAVLVVTHHSHRLRRLRQGVEEPAELAEGA